MCRGAWKQARGLDSASWNTDYTTVSLPTGGVFAEAVCFPQCRTTRITRRPTCFAVPCGCLSGWVNSSGCLPSQRRGCSVFLIINLLMQVLGRFNAAEKKDYLRFTEWDKYKTTASMATNFNAQRSDGLLQNVSPPSHPLTLASSGQMYWVCHSPAWMRALHSHAY